LSLTGLEHDQKYLRIVAATLRSHDLTNYKLIHSPLRPIAVDGREVEWYDPLDIDRLPKEIDALIVDGPPNLRGRGNRSPAWSLLRDRIVSGGLILVDDTHRRDERRMVESWLRQDSTLSLVADCGSFMALERL